MRKKIVEREPHRIKSISFKGLPEPALRREKSNSFTLHCASFTPTEWYSQSNFARSNNKKKERGPIFLLQTKRNYQMGIVQFIPLVSHKPVHSVSEIP